MLGYQIWIDKLDELVLWRQRTVFISNDVTVQRSHDDYNERKASQAIMSATVKELSRVLKTAAKSENCA